jgi:hypothetical protein
MDAGGGGARGRKPAEFPEALVPALVRFLLSVPGQAAPKAAAGFVAAQAAQGGADGKGPCGVTQVATRDRIASLAMYDKRRWVPTAGALLIAGLSAAQADAMRAPPPPRPPCAPKPPPGALAVPAAFAAAAAAAAAAAGPAAAAVAAAAPPAGDAMEEEEDAAAPTASPSASPVASPVASPAASPVDDDVVVMME